MNKRDTHIPTPKREIHKTFTMKTFTMAAQEVISVPIFGTGATDCTEKGTIRARRTF